MKNPVGRLRFTWSFGAIHFDIYVEVRQRHQFAVAAKEPKEVDNEPQITFMMVSTYPNMSKIMLFISSS